MKYLRNFKFIGGISLILVGLTMTSAWFFLRRSPHEITRAEFDQIINTQSLTDAKLNPTLYPGIFYFEASRPAGTGTERVFLTTHLDEAQLSRVAALKGIKLALPQPNLRAQWISIQLGTDASTIEEQCAPPSERPSKVVSSESISWMTSRLSSL